MGSAPGLILGGCHGPDEKEVFAELLEIVEEAIALYQPTESLFHHLRPAVTLPIRSGCRLGNSFFETAEVGKHMTTFKIEVNESLSASILQALCLSPLQK